MVFIGMATVFAVLVLIMFSLYGFKFFFHDLPNKRAAEVKQAPAPVEQVVEAPSSNDEEIVAALAAAIAMAESESNGVKFRVVSFKRREFRKGDFKMKRYTITVNGTAYDVVVEEADASGVVMAPVAPVQAAPVAAPAAPKAAAKPAAAGATSVTAPMPGTILDVKVSVGQSVKKGDVICVLEAMKMENDIPAPADGVIASINVQKGASVAANDILASLN